MNLRDSAERIFWSVLVAALTNFGSVDFLDIAAWKAAALAGINAAVTFLLLVARTRLSVLPDPGEGLPGLPVDEPVSVADRLRELGLHDEPTTPERGAVDLVGALYLVALVIVILCGLKFLGAI